MVHMKIPLKPFHSLMQDLPFLHCLVQGNLFPGRCAETSQKFNKPLLKTTFFLPLEKLFCDVPMKGMVKQHREEPSFWPMLLCFLCPFRFISWSFYTVSSFLGDVEISLHLEETFDNLVSQKDCWGVIL